MLTTIRPRPPHHTPSVSPPWRLSQNRRQECLVPRLPYGAAWACSSLPSSKHLPARTLRLAAMWVRPDSIASMETGARSRQRPGLAMPSPRGQCVYFDGKTARNLQTGIQHLRFVSNLGVYGFATLNAPFLRRSLLRVCVYTERVCALCWGPHNCQPVRRNGTPSWFPSPENHPVWDWVRVVVSKHQLWVSLAEEG